MVDRQNIQKLVSAINALQVKAYMIAEGWQVTDDSTSDHATFERPNPEEDSDHRIWIWNSSEHPKFRSRLLNLLFSLAVIDKREPLDIANEIFEKPAMSLFQPASDMALVGEMLRSELSGVIARAPDDTLEQAILRVEFELDGPGPFEPESVKRTVAVFASAICQAIESSDANAGIVWRVCAQLVERGGMRLVSHGHNELLRTAAEDNPLSPKQTLAWLNENATS